MIRHEKWYFLLFLCCLLLIGCSTAVEKEAEPAAVVEEEAAVPDESIEEPSVVEDTSSQEESVWTASSPVAVFTDEDIAFLDISCSGSDEEIANCIEDWQSDNFTFCVGSDGEDLIPECSYFLEYNEILPGIMTSKDVIYNNRVDDKIAGICMDYAAVYCSIAEYYGLECRVMRSTTHYCDEMYCDEEDEAGWMIFDYMAFQPLLSQNGLDFSLAAINSVVEDNWAHYWAEVMIDGEWEFRDASARDTAQRYSRGEDVVVDWVEMDKSDEMSAFMAE